jgi:FKBP-type peptidyl-prolyl cis-trans isomerase 2
MGQDPDGTQRPARVHEVLDDMIVLDLNHRLAGQNLNFEIKIVAIE